MYRFKSIFFIIVSLNVYLSESLISDKRLCMNKECSVPVSLAKTLLNFNSPEPGILSFSSNQEVKIFSKEAGSVNELWGAEINGKRGYLPKKFVREIKIFGKPTVVVDTESTVETPQKVPTNEKEKVEPNSVKKPYEVVDGTTIYLDSNSINPSVTENPILSTATPTVIQESQETKEENNKQPTTVEIDDKKENIKEIEASVVGDVFNSLKNWMNKDSNEDEESDDDEEEDDEDDEAIEEDNNTIDKPDTNKEKVNSVTGKVLDKVESRKSEPIEEVKQGEKEFGITESIKTLPINEIKQVEEKNLNVLASKEGFPNEEVKQTEVFDDKILVKLESNKPLNDGKDSKIVDEKTLKKSETEPKDVIKEEEIVNQKIFKESESKKPIDVVKESEVNEKILENKKSLLNEIKHTDEALLEDKNNEADKVESNSLGTESIINKNEVINQIENKALSLEDNNNILKLEEKLGMLDTTTETSVELNEAIPIIESAGNVTPNPLETITGDKLEVINSPEENSAENLTEPIKDPVDFNNKIDLKDSITSFIKKKESNNEQILEVSSSELNTNSDSPKEKITSGLDNMELPANHQKETEFFNDFDIINTNNANVDNFDEKVNDEKHPIDSNLIKTDSETLISSEIFNNIDNTGLPFSKEFENDQIINQDISNNMKNGNNFIEDQPQIEGDGLFAKIYSFLGSFLDKKVEDSISDEPIQVPSVVQDPNESFCDLNPCEKLISPEENLSKKSMFTMNPDILLYLGTTAIACIIFIILFVLVEGSNKKAPLIEKINKLEKELMICIKEKEELQEGKSSVDGTLSSVPNKEVEAMKLRLLEYELNQQELDSKIENLQKIIEEKEGLEEQIESLEKELETSTEVGMELNRIISEMLDPTNGSEKLKENVEQLQRQLLEQKGIINDINKALSDKENENEDLLKELNESRKKAGDLQKKLDEIVDQILKIQKERDQQLSNFQEELTIYQQKFREESAKKEVFANEIEILRGQLMDAQRKADIKIKEYQNLKDSLDNIKLIKNDKNALQSLLDATTSKAEVEHLRVENDNFAKRLKEEESSKKAFEKKCQSLTEEFSVLEKKYKESDKEKVEVTMKLEVLNNYFKKREEELQSELIKYKSIWDTKEGEATSTTERMKLLTEEIENYKSQNETLKQEIISQEIDLKSQISMLEKKVHENWVISRQMERKLEDARQEAAQLRNRLTLRERTNEERIQNRIQSPLNQNGDLTLSPPPIESPASPSLMFGGRDHITKSPPLPGLPPFLPPPPGAPFMPPPLPGMPFMPPPPSMFPGDHRPPPLGRMSSPPPLNSRYSPDTSAFSPYERNTPSPPYDSEYGASPPPIRGYSPYSRDDRREYKRPKHVNGRNKGSLASSGSDHSNDSLGKGNRKMV